MQLRPHDAWLDRVPRPPPQHAGATERRIAAAADRLEDASAALVILRGPGVEERRRRAADLLDQVRARHAAGEEILGMVARAEAAITEVEHAVLELDAGVSSGAFRGLLEAPDVDLAAMLRFARLLVRSFEPNARCSDRILSIVARLVAGAGANGEVILRSRAAIDPALRYLVGDHRATDEVKTPAITFFRGAIERLDEFFLVDHIFDFGFYLDVRGYEAVLGEAVLDPDILYVAAELRMGLERRLREFLDNGTVDRAQLAQYFADVEAQVGSALEPEEEPPQAAAIAARFDVRKPPPEAIALATAPKRARAGTKVKWVIAFALVAGLAAGALRRTTRNNNELDPIPASAVAAISPHLESGSISRGAADAVFIGKVAPVWPELAASEKREVAEAIVQHLAARNVQTGVVYWNATVAIQIAHGKILFAQ